MSDMVRKQIYISRRHQTMLKRLSAQSGLSESEIIRQAIDRQAINAAPGDKSTNRVAWDKAYQFMRLLSERAGQFSEPYQWDREELYEQRLSRYVPQAGENSEV